MNGVIRADKKIGADFGQLVGGGEHQFAHALPVVAVNAFHVLGQ